MPRARGLSHANKAVLVDRPPPPPGAKVSVVHIDGHECLVYEFPFTYFKKFGRLKLKDLAGYAHAGAKLILLNSELDQAEKRWTLQHEINHIRRWMRGQSITEPLWDELETELLTLADASLSDIRGPHMEVLVALKSYMDYGEDHFIQARKLVDWLRGETDGQKEGPAIPVGLPEDSVRAG